MPATKISLSRPECPAPFHARRNSILLQPATVVCAALLWLLGFASCGDKQPLATGADAQSAPDAVHSLPRPELAATRGYILISIDTLSAEHLSAYGYERPTSPFFDQLAERGVLFEEAIVQLPGTLPSHMSMLTGLYPEQHGVFPPDGRLSEGIETVSELFERAGYATAGHTEGGYVEGKFGFDRGFTEFSDEAKKIETDVERTFARGLDFLNRVGERPFFLFLHSYVVHDPYFPEAPYDSLFWSDPAPEVFPPTGPNLVAVNRGERQLSALQLDYFKALYDGSVRYMDDQLQVLFAGIEALGLLEHSTIVLTSDHGEEFLEHGSLVHDQVYRQTLRVPLLLLHPDISQGHRVKAPVESIDITPTLLDFAGLTASGPLAGRSLVPYLGPAGASATTGSAYAIDYSRRVRTLHRRTADGYHHLFETSRGARRKFELFDLQADPAEQDNALDGQSEQAKELKRLLADYQLEPLAQSETRELDPELEERLRSLGYLQ